MPTGEQSRLMRCFAGCCRFVFNKALALQQDRLAGALPKLGYVGLCRQLTTWRHDPETAWLAEAPAQPLQQALNDLERAYTNFFKQRAGPPKFRHRGWHDRFRYPDRKQIKLDQSNGRIFLPKLGWLRYRNSRNLQGNVRNVTLSLSAGKWYVSILTQRDVVQPISASTGAIGIDLGIVRFATFSDGNFIAPINSFKRHQQLLARYQRRLRRKVKFSRNWKKVQARVQKLHARIADIRRDFLQKATTTISKNHALVCIEDLQVGKMVKSARGTAERPGRNVKQKAGLNRAILDQGWYELRRQLHYKMAWSGGLLVVVPPRHTSQTCPQCGYVSPDNRRTQARFLCTGCGYANNADVVGAMNILERGHRLLACGEMAQPGRSTKQEPTEATGNASHGAAGIPFL